MSQLTRLPKLGDGPDAFQPLIDTFGKENVYQFIRLCRTFQKTAGEDVAGDLQTTLAQQMVDAEVEKSNVTREVAARTIAGRLGYADMGARSNFYKILKGEKRPDRRNPNVQKRS